MLRGVPGLSCLECAEWTEEFERGWRAYLTDDRFEPAEAVVYCPACAEREFGPPREPAREDTTD